MNLQQTGERDLILFRAKQPSATKTLDATGRTTYVYDVNGNQQIEIPAAGNRTTTTWNYENQPTLYRLPSGVRVTMLYNVDNRRIETQEP
jgi:uncharacterized protein RhaS with RHS repeats